MSEPASGTRSVSQDANNMKTEVGELFLLGHF